MLVLSPVLTFFGASSSDDNTVRAKLARCSNGRPRATSQCSASSPLKTGSAEVFAGSDAYRRACRAAWRLAFDPADDEPIEKLKRRVMFAAKVNNAPDALRLAYRIEGVELPGGISTSRVVFKALSPRRPRLFHRFRMFHRGHEPEAAAVRSWLARQLADGPQDGATLKRAAANADVDPQPVPGCNGALGVIREPIDGTPRKLWRMPDAV